MIFILFREFYHYGLASKKRIDDIAFLFNHFSLDSKPLVLCPYGSNKNDPNIHSINFFSYHSVVYVNFINFFSFSNKFLYYLNVILFQYISFFTYINFIRKLISPSDIVYVYRFFLWQYLIIRLIFPHRRFIFELNEYPFFSTKFTIIKKLKEFIFFKFVLTKNDYYILMTDQLIFLLNSYQLLNSNWIKLPPLIISQNEDNR